MFFPMMPLRVTPRWGYKGCDWPPRPRLMPGVIKIASLRDAPGFSNARARTNNPRAPQAQEDEKAADVRQRKIRAEANVPESQNKENAA
jgi:hypothetical protein